MTNGTTFVEALRSSLELENALNELVEIRDEAFNVFNNIPLGDLNRIFETYWKELFKWNQKHEYENLPRLFLQDIEEVQEIFEKVTTAYINRKEFEEALTQTCQNIEACITKMRLLLSAKNKELDCLYNEFAQSTGELRFIFEAYNVKKLIMNKLLKS